MPDISQLTVLPRPRNAWQAIDAGFTLARAHYFQLLVLWLVLAVPIFALCMLLQIFLGWSYAILIWWWCKPLYELPVHLFLSRALFSEQATLRSCMHRAFSQLGALLKTYLGIFRFSGVRSMGYGPVFLEKATFRQRGARMQQLAKVPTRATLLLMACLHVEFLLQLITVGIIGMFLPETSFFTDVYLYFTSDSTDEVAWVLLALSVGTFIGAALVAPFYVAGGFLCYINRRMMLEAWDIEHRFRNVSQKRCNPSHLVGSSGVIAVLTVICTLLLLNTPSTSFAQEREIYLPDRDTTNTLINDIHSHPDFGGLRTTKIPIFTPSDEEKDESSSPMFENIEAWVTALAANLKILIWIAGAVFLALAIYTVFRFRSLLKPPTRLAPGDNDQFDVHNHPLTAALPKDIVEAARAALAKGDSRQTLSLLFRGALRSIMGQYDISIKGSATEADCKVTVASVANTTQQQTFNQVIEHWQQTAYANVSQSTTQLENLISNWANTFGSMADRNNSANASLPNGSDR